MIDIIVIGAGAAGMMAAITAARAGKKILVLEKKEDIGKKILATGNGKCNFTNLDMNIDKYNGDKKLAEIGLFRFDENDAISFFRELGILEYSNNGYIYPYSKQATSIVQALRMEMTRLKIDIRTGVSVEKIIKKSDRFIIKSGKSEYEGQKIIIATGLKASPKLGSDGSIFPALESLGHSFTKITPALCGFYCEGLKFNKISGVRTDARISAVINDEVVATDEGELQIVDYGVSGIPVFQISRHISQALSNKKSAKIKVDFFPRFSYEQLEDFLSDRISHTKDKRSINELLNGVLNNKLVLELIHKSGISPDKKAFDITSEEIEALVNVIKNTVLIVKKSRAFEFAQVCAGGINSTQICPDTLESKITKGMYFAGEILNVDGKCGGYNLQWAWSSGFIAGMESSK